jgi:hypothetical protein
MQLILVCVGLAFTTTLVAAMPASAQLPEGIGLGITPTAERIDWNDDILLEDATLLGGRASLNFGRYVALEGYYTWEDDVAIDSGDDASAESAEVDIKRRGADLVFTFADFALAPYIRAGAGILEFDGDAVDSEHLMATLGGGVKLDLTDRLQASLFVQDVALRANRAPFIEPEDDEDTFGDEKTFHSLSYGAGINFYLGGADQSETDEALRTRLREGFGGLSVPVELFAGELQFDDELELEDQNVAGVRTGLNLGPYFGLRGYYLRGVNGDFDDFQEFDGYGGEAVFNLSRPEGFTPYLVVGLGRLNFTDEQDDAGLIDDDKWSATAGAGLTFSLSPRFRLEGSARNILFTRSDIEDLTHPDELTSNWLYSGGLRFAIGGESAAESREEAVREAREREERQRLRRAERAEIEDRPLAPADTLEIKKGRREDGDRRARRRVDTIEIPVLEEGEIYIRFGESGTFERMGAIADTAGLVEERIAIVGGDTARMAALIERLDRRLEEIDERLDRMEAQPRGGVTDLDVDIEEEERIERPEAIQEPGEQGVFRGGGIETAKYGGYTGIGIYDPTQALLGFVADLGPAFGGNARFVPQADFGFGEDLSFTLNGHLVWPLAVRRIDQRPFEPYLGVGLGLFASEGELDLLVPNLVAGAAYLGNRYEPFAEFQALGFFDQSRFLFGIRRF